MFGHQLGRLPGEIAFVGRQLVGPLADQLEREHISVTNGYLVDQRDGMKYRGQLVIAVLAAIADRQIEVDLSGHPNGDRPGGHPQFSGVAVRCGHRSRLSL
ncbi:Uncharacterised protein [Mycobacterium tuberculosis]|uniref:Uncharacterized protein n=1 Tax=Mycobacterium tuberculosis TaxID=1773 RepID=A0A655AKB4_MYCTX|nr:Uncharacterised protein [Mycobacterium tuberculosis]CKS65449.1 Uncharacterised protein [Mycobacterium tuberculosis]CKT11034.1 Uncharacterised protein [Mycobacterium tuberculosis]CKT26124.1 Uncharacterised protein [Mycobacterium tuberculosis]CKT30231.1 Uncharacterised protein [Mycobacterium tuberculosis]